MRAVPTLLLTLLAAVGCSEAPRPDSAAPPAIAGSANPAAAPGAMRHAAPVLEGRVGELVNPEAASVVLLYFDLAGIPPPVEQWLERDMRVQLAPAAGKPAARDLVRHEIEAGLAAVRKVGALRIPLQANLSDYDATYGEFTVRALAPSAVLEFESFGQKVAVKFGNARQAQVWRVPADQAQAVRDRLGFANDATVDALLQIRDVHAGPDGGTLTTHVLEYELRESRGGTLLGRVQLAP